MKNKLKKYSKKILAICLTTCLVIASCVSLVGCSNETTTVEEEYVYEAPIYNTTGEKQKAIIILPGILGSNLVDAKTNEPLWSGGALLNNLFMTVKRVTMDDITNFFTRFMKKDDKGNSAVQIKAATMNDMYLEYGLIDQYKELYRFFDKKYGQKSTSKEYVVQVFQYDWTKSARSSADDLEKFINANNYEDNILVGHSLGGLVCDYYLTKQENQNKTDGFISLGTPHLGAYDALIAAFSDIDIDLSGLSTLIPDGLIESLLDNMGGINIKKMIPEAYEGKELQFVQDLTTMLVSTIRTMPSLYDLIPGKELFNEGTVFVDNQPQTYSDFINKAKLIPSIQNSPAVLNAFTKALENRVTLYNESNVFASEQIGLNTFYIAANGKKDTLTTNGLSFTTDANNSLKLKIDTTNPTRVASYTPYEFAKDDYIFTNYVPLYNGDGMVLVKSATLLKPQTEENVRVLNGFIDHLDIVSPKVQTDSSLNGANENEVRDLLIHAMDVIKSY